MNNQEALDLATVAGALPSFSLRKERARTQIAEHLERFGGYVAWSGGRDSTAVVLLAVSIDPGVPVVWFDSGLEYPETHAYIEALRKDLSINLHVIRSNPTALDVLRESGVWDHSAELGFGTDLHEVLISLPSQEAHSRFGFGELSGLRAEESVGRRALLARENGRYRRKDGSEVCAPLWAWSSSEISALLRSQNCPENPVYAKLASVGAPERARRVGLVVDGNNAHNGRYTYLRAGWPDLWGELVSVLPRLNEWR